MIDILTAVIVVLATLQPTLHRFYVASTFAVLTLIHNYSMYELEGIAYYGSDALFYFAIIAITSKLHKITDLTISIHRICLAAIALDAFGWVIWMLYIPPAVYNYSFMALYAYAVFTLIKRDKADERGGYAMGGWNNYIRVIAGTSNPVLQSHREAQ